MEISVELLQKEILDKWEAVHKPPKAGGLQTDLNKKWEGGGEMDDFFDDDDGFDGPGLPPLEEVLDYDYFQGNTNTRGIKVGV